MNEMTTSTADSSSSETRSTTNAAVPPNGPRSMTGFARVQRRSDDKLGFTLSLKSVNHRFLDLHIQLPSALDTLEPLLRRLLKERLSRGHVELRVSLDRTATDALQFNRTLIGAYVNAYSDAATQFGLPHAPDLNVAFRLPGALTVEATISDEEIAALAEPILEATEELIANLNTVRSEEGALLAQVLRGCMVRLDDATLEVGKLRGETQAAHFERLRNRMLELVGNAVEQDRILAEAALIAERSAVEEEVVRLRTHIAQFTAMLSNGVELGKKLDFLLQEMNREANTLLSKTNGVVGNGLRITELGLLMKSEIEKAREQVQNLE